MEKRIRELCDRMLSARNGHAGDKPFTVAISGIDASGKGYVTGLLEEELKQRGFRVANINLDPWQNPTTVRLDKNNPAENFYEKVFRWDEVFEQLILPLKSSGSIHLEARLIRNDGDEGYPHTYQFEKIQFLLLDAILLLQEEYIPLYDYKVWIECSFEQGLKRALKRNQERLDEADIIRDYETYYYPAQRLHFDKDYPKAKADFIFDNG